MKLSPATNRLIDAMRKSNEAEQRKRRPQLEHRMQILMAAIGAMKNEHKKLLKEWRATFDKPKRKRGK